MIRWKCLLCDEEFESHTECDFEFEIYNHMESHKDDYIEVLE